MEFVELSPLLCQYEIALAVDRPKGEEDSGAAKNFMDEDLDKIRGKIDELNTHLLRLLEARADLVRQAAAVKSGLQLPAYDPKREDRMMARLLEQSRGSLTEAQIIGLFRHIFSVFRNLAEQAGLEGLGVHISRTPAATVVDVAGVKIGPGRPPAILAGPCALESHEQAEELLAYFTRELPADRFVFRCGLYKPRTSPYSFAGLGRQGLELLARLKKIYQVPIVSEITSPKLMEDFEGLIDLWQVGARNMTNFDLLRELGRTRTPILLKRSYAATVEELLLAAEYIYAQGNTNIILCERGIRTFESWTRFTLDISAVPLVKSASHLPIIVDISHSTGRPDLAGAVAGAALAAGADGIMVEVHPHPDRALSDGFQQLSLDQFDRIKKVFFPAV